MAREIRVYRDVNDEWRWNVRAANGLIVAESGEGYHNRNDCLDMVTSLHPDLPIYEDA